MRDFTMAPHRPLVRIQPAVLPVTRLLPLRSLRPLLAPLPLLALLPLITACQGNAPTAPAFNNSLALVSISPAAGTRLTAGSSVSFNGTLSYSVANAGAANLSLVFEDQGNRVLNPTSQPTSVLPAGQGSVTLGGQLTLPASGVTQLQVIYTLTPDTSIPVPVSAEATYPVGP